MGNNTTSTTCGDDDDLPIFSEDVLIRVLVWLPVISLLRFKSVCKSWRALIETPFFIDLHTTTTTTFNFSSSSKFGCFILHSSDLYCSHKMYMLSSKSRSGSGCGGCDDDDDDDIIDNDQADSLGSLLCYIDPLYARLIYMHMVGSCNGLICIHVEEGEEEGENEAVYLWNPATRQFRILPKPIITIEEEEEEEGVFVMYPYPFLAFGFDVKTKDYKVVRLRPFRTPAMEYYSRIQVYSLSTDSWRLLEGMHYLPAIPYNVSSQNHGIYMNGCYFFVGRDDSQVWPRGGSGKNVVCNNSLMYSFDFTKEILTTMQFPDHDSEDNLILSCWGGDKIAVFIIQRNKTFRGSNNGLDYEYYLIWLLNEQPGSNWVGVVNKESWTKLHSFQKINKIKYPTHPKCISNNGKFALISIRTPTGASELQLFNLVTKEAVKKDFPFEDRIERAYVYTQSLVSI